MKHPPRETQKLRGERVHWDIERSNREGGGTAKETKKIPAIRRKMRREVVSQRQERRMFPERRKRPGKVRISVSMNLTTRKL